MFLLNQSHVQLWTVSPLRDANGNPQIAPAGVFPGMAEVAAHISQHKLTPDKYVILACAVLQSPLQMTSPIGGHINGKQILNA